jgi:dTDP-glucose 4,6-dehydratase
MNQECHPCVVLVTGGAGFIGVNFVRHLLQTDARVRLVNLDALTYAGSLSSLEGVEQAYPSRYRFVHGSICDEQLVARLFTEEPIDTIVHFAAESHVDRSITGPRAFVDTNIVGTYVLLQHAVAAHRQRGNVRFHHVSTDEVYGSLGPAGLFTEETPYDPSSPYSASKAAADHLVRAWGRTFELPVTISNCSNNYGPYQFPEKLIPLMVANAMAGKPLPVYGAGRNVRDWLHVGDHCQAIDLIVRRGVVGRTYNVGGANEWTNIDIVRLICDLLDAKRPRTAGSYRELITFVADRPGHDLRYAIDSSRLRSELGWSPRYTFETGLSETIDWYLAHGSWLAAIAAARYSGERLGLVAPAGSTPDGNH